MIARVVIHSDGTPYGTKITDELGEPIHGARSVRWACGIDGPARADIEFVLVATGALQGEARFYICHPHTGEHVEIAGFVHPDGTIEDLRERRDHE